MTAPSPQPTALLHEGKAKRVYATADPHVHAVEFKDTATAFNARKREDLPGKGALNCLISAHLFTLLEQAGIPTHFRGLLRAGWMAVAPLQILPLEVVLRNRAAGSLLRELPVAAGQQLEPALLDLYYKDDSLGDPLLSEERLALLDGMQSLDLAALQSLARQVNTCLRSSLATLELDLVDLKLELGLSRNGELILGDELSPDNCRLWDLRQPADSPARILDKDRFRQDLGGLIEAYGNVLERIRQLGCQPRYYG